jgi:hypothetical protein
VTPNESSWLDRAARILVRLGFAAVVVVGVVLAATVARADNSGGGEQTGKLEEKRSNKVTIVIQ